MRVSANEPSGKWVVSENGIGHIITIVLVMAGMFVTWGSTQTRINELETSVRDIRAEYTDVLKSVTTELRSMNSRISRLEGKLEK